MLSKFILTIISCVASALFGYCVSLIKTLSKKNKASDEALLTLLQNALTNVYFVYENIGRIPDYIYRNWLKMLSAYEALGGDDYVHILADRMKAWDIEHTGILK